MYSEITLHQFEISPFCGKVRKLLRAKKLDFRVINYNGVLALKRKSLSSTAKLPILEYQGEKIQDSTQIAKFLDENFPEPPLYPRDPDKKTQAMILEDWADEYLYWFEIYFFVNYPDNLEIRSQLLSEGRSWIEKIILKLICWIHGRRDLHGQGLGRLNKQELEARFIECLQCIDSLLTSQPFMLGNSPTIADYAISAQLDEMIRTSHMKKIILSYSRIEKWLMKLQ